MLSNKKCKKEKKENVKSQVGIKFRLTNHR